jgi:hypothetical protein
MNREHFFDAFPHLENLLAGFGACVEAAKGLKTPNVEDDVFIRCGMIGFARHLSLDVWDYDHFRYVGTLCNDVATDEFSIGWRYFTALAAGYFLGMRCASLINDLDLRLAEAHTPGFMWLNPTAFDSVQ